MAQKPDRLEWRLARLSQYLISLTAEHMSRCTSQCSTIASNVKTTQKDPADVTLKEKIEFSYFGKGLGMENANKTHEQASWDQFTI